MTRDTTPYVFIDADPQTMVDTLTRKYEDITQKTVHPASPEKLFIQWVASAMVLLAEQINFAGNQNIPSKAVGEGLDNLAQIFYAQTRPQAKPATTILRFTVSNINRTTAVIISAGTRVSTIDRKVVFITDEELLVPVPDPEPEPEPETVVVEDEDDDDDDDPEPTPEPTPDPSIVEVTATCETAGVIGNDYAPGQLSLLVDPIDYVSAVANATTTDGGSDTASDDDFYELLVLGQDAYTSAGAKGAYEYYTKKVSTEIRDVIVNSPSPCVVHIYAVMKDGTPATSEVKTAILEACNDEHIRPLTDLVSVEDAELITYDIDATYYLSRDSTESAATIQERVEAAVQEFILWESAKIGRDINPSKLHQLVIEAGAKRIVIRSPTFTVLKNGQVLDPTTAQASDYVPQLAMIGTVTLTNGGYEDE